MSVEPDYVALLRAAIAAAGGSARAFARRPLLRNERTIRRWLAGEQPIPKEVRDYLLETVKPEGATGATDPKALP